MGPALRKRVFGHMRTAKVQIRLRIRFQWSVNARMRLCTCVRLCKSAHFAHARRHFSLDAAHVMYERVHIAHCAVTRSFHLTTQVATHGKQVVLPLALLTERINTARPQASCPMKIEPRCRNNVIGVLGTSVIRPN